MEQTYEDLTKNFKCVNENHELDIKGTVIKFELKPQVNQIQKPNERHKNPNQDKHFAQFY